MPAIWAAAMVSVLVTVWIIVPGEPWGRALFVVIAVATLVAFVRLTAWPFMKWRANHFVVTTERVLLREGVFSRKQRDIPLTRLNEVSVNYSLIDRLLGSGVIVVGAPGEHGQIRTDNIPHVLRVQRLINELVRMSGHRRGADVPALEKTLGKLSHESTRENRGRRAR